jgi:multidrug transporter EmrE-like cation transporter
MLIAFVLLAISGIVLTVGDLFMKKWVVSNNYVFHYIGLAIYLVGLIFLAHSFKYKNIAVATVISIVINLATLTLVSWLYFKEALTLGQGIGVFLGVLSIVFLELGDTFL